MKAFRCRPRFQHPHQPGVFLKSRRWDGPLNFRQRQALARRARKGILIVDWVWVAGFTKAWEFRDSDLMRVVTL